MTIAIANANANANAAIINTDSTINVNTDSTSTVNAADAANKDLAGVMMAMRQRIEALAVEREAWELTAYARSNELLYGVMQKCYALYNDLTQRTGDVGARKMALQDYIDGKGLAFKPDTLLTAKIIRCVFGAKDRRRLSTYHTVLRVIVANKWAVDQVPAKIAEFGGVQEISLGKPLGSLTPKQKAEQARSTVLATSLATVASHKLAIQNDPEKIGEQAVAVVTQNADGSYTIHCVVHSSAAVNVALAGYFGANKDAIKQTQAQQATTAAVLSQTQLIAAAGQAANMQSAAMAA